MRKPSDQLETLLGCFAGRNAPGGGCRTASESRRRWASSAMAPADQPIPGRAPGVMRGVDRRKTRANADRAARPAGGRGRRRPRPGRPGQAPALAAAPAAVPRRRSTSRYGYRAALRVNRCRRILLCVPGRISNDNWRPAFRTFPCTARPGWPARRDFPLRRSGRFPALRCGPPCARWRIGVK